MKTKALRWLNIATIIAALGGIGAMVYILVVALFFANRRGIVNVRVLDYGQEGWYELPLMIFAFAGLVHMLCREVAWLLKNK